MCHGSLLGTSEAASNQKKMLLQDSATVGSVARKRGEVKVSPKGQWQTPVRGGGHAQPENGAPPGGMSTAGVSASKAENKGRFPDSCQLCSTGDGAVCPSFT